MSANAPPSWLPFPLPRAQALAAPVLICIMLSMLVLPLPPFLLDVFFSFNIAVALVVLLVASYTIKPLDFAAFPTILLITTMLRLALNVASTRAVLMHGHTGPDAAGKVIESFANFLIGGNFAVGIIVFAILTVINFIVVTKGAGRIAEVSARFALDAMPGKQMSIDAELNAGSIDDKEARRRRLEVSQEADFYGSMDGASKFVRGDAIASMLILAINVVGGLAIGLIQHNLPLERAASNYVLLAIGDALVAQIPALVVSLAAGLIVSRVGQEDDIGGQVGSQLFKMPRALGLSVVRTRVMATAMGGFFGGVAGAYLSRYYPGSWNEALSSGQGVMAVALVIFARWRPLGCFRAALIFGGAGSIGPALQAVGIQAGYHLWNAAPYVLTLAIMLASTSRARASIGAPGELSMTR